MGLGETILYHPPYIPFFGKTSNSKIQIRLFFQNGGSFARLLQLPALFIARELNLEELLRSELVGEEEIMQMLEDMGVRNLTNINDLFAFDFPSVLDSLGLDPEAWSQNLEFVTRA